MQASIHLSGDKAFIIRFGQAINPETLHRVKSYEAAINALQLKGITQIIPTYCELTVCYEPAQINYKTLLDHLKQINILNTDNTTLTANTLHIPVCYNHKYGPDITTVAEKNQLSVKEVIHIHSSPRYLIYMLGFTPGFVYLGGLDKRIATPRQAKPRTSIDAGSVGIAGNQTGVYPINSPGGWQLIGKTPLKMFDLNRQPEVLVSAGDYIKFDPVNEEQFYEIESKIKSGKYRANIKKTRSTDE